MSKRFTFIVLAIIGIPALLFALTTLYIYANSDEIKNKLLAEINATSGVKVSINGSVELAFLRHFPKVALELQGVEVRGTDTLRIPFVKAGNVYLLASLLDVVHGNWKIETTSIENGEVTMLRMKDGSINYGFNSTSADSSSAHKESPALQIDEALLKNIHFRLTDELAEVDINLQVDDAVVKGNFSAENLSLKTTGNIYSHRLEIKEVDYAHEKQISFDGSLAVATEKESYTLAIPKFILENNEFAINGSIVMKENNPVFDLAVRGKNISIKDLPLLLPVQYASKLNGIKGRGKIQLSAEIKGKLDDRYNPQIIISAGVADAAVQIPGMENKIEGLDFNSVFSNGPKQSLATSSLVVSSLRAKTKEGELHGAFTLINFENPWLKFEADGMLDLSLFNRFMPDSSRLRELKGEIEFTNLKYAGKASDLASGKIKGAEGSLKFNSVIAKIDTQQITVSEAEMEANAQSLSIRKLEMQMPGSKFSVNGKIMQMSGMGNSNDVPSVDLTVTAESINIGSLLALTNNQTSNPKEKKKDSFGLNGFIRLNSSFIGWKKFKAYDASATLTFNGHVAEIKDFSCNTMDGTLEIHSKIEVRDSKIATTSTAEGGSLNITELFYQLDNFNQQTITSKNVAGNLDFTANINADFLNGTLNEKTLTATSELTISKGQLVDFQPLERLSKFIDIEELRNIKFSTLQNTVSIANRTVNIPEMLVQSNALSLAVSGKQEFDGAIDYKVKVNIFDVLAKKFRKRKNTVDYEEVSENNFNLYLSMKGTAENPIIKHEKIGFKERIAQQKEDFQLLKKKQSAPDNKSQEGYKEKTIFTNKRQKPEQEEEPEFIEWDNE